MSRPNSGWVKPSSQFPTGALLEVLRGKQQLVDHIRDASTWVIEPAPLKETQEGAEALKKAVRKLQEVKKEVAGDLLAWQRKRDRRVQKFYRTVQGLPPAMLEALRNEIELSNLLPIPKEGIPDNAILEVCIDFAVRTLKALPAETRGGVGQERELRDVRYAMHVCWLLESHGYGLPEFKEVWTVLGPHLHKSKLPTHLDRTAERLWNKKWCATLLARLLHNT